MSHECDRYDTMDHAVLDAANQPLVLVVDPGDARMVLPKPNIEHEQAVEHGAASDGRIERWTTRLQVGVLASPPLSHAAGSGG